MNTETTLRLLKNAGFHILGTDGSFIYIEDPSCILRSFETFIEYAWTAIFLITGMLLFGWAISLIRGGKTDLITNLRNLTLMFGTLTLAVPIINLIFGDDLFARGCRTIQISRPDIDRLLDARSAQFAARNTVELYDNIDIIDHGITATPQSPERTDPIINEPDLEPMENNNPIEPILQPRPTPPASSDAPTQPTARTLDMSIVITRVTEQGGDVIYTDASGGGIRRTGGSRAWRNQNPGNIRDSKFARRMGAIGAAGGFAVFPDAETGARAIAALLTGNSYRNLTVADAIARYAPPHENDTAAYQQNLARLTGIDIGIYIRDLTKDQLNAVVSAIRRVEGWTPGREIAI